MIRPIPSTSISDATALGALTGITDPAFLIVGKSTSDFARKLTPTGWGLSNLLASVPAGRVPYSHTDGTVTSNAGLAFSPTTSGKLTVSGGSNPAVLFGGSTSADVMLRKGTAVSAGKPTLYAYASDLSSWAYLAAQGLYDGPSGILWATNGMGYFSALNTALTAYQAVGVSQVNLFGASTLLDTSITRDSAGVARVGNGGTGVGGLITGPLTVQQSGGVAGTDDATHVHNGTTYTITNRDTGGVSHIRLALAGGEYIEVQRSSGLAIAPIGTTRYLFQNADGRLGSGVLLGWSASAIPTSSANDIAFGRNGINCAEVNTGTAGAFADLKLRNLTATDGSLTVTRTSGTSHTIARWPTRYSGTSDAEITANGGGIFTGYTSLSGYTLPENTTALRCGNGGSNFALVFQDGATPHIWTYQNKIRAYDPFKLRNWNDTADQDLTCAGVTASRAAGFGTDGIADEHTFRGNIVQFKLGSVYAGNATSAGFAVRDTGKYQFASLSYSYAAADTELTRSSAGYVGLGTPSTKVVVGSDGSNGSVSFGNGRILFSGSGNGYLYGQGGSSVAHWFGGSGFAVSNGQYLGFTPGAADAALADTVLTRSSAGMVRIGTTSNGVVVGHDGTNSDVKSTLGPLWLRAGQFNGNVLFSRVGDGTAANSATFAVMGGTPAVRLRADVPLTWSASAADTLGTQGPSIGYTSSTMRFTAPYSEGFDFYDALNSRRVARIGNAGTGELFLGTTSGTTGVYLNAETATARVPSSGSFAWSGTTQGYDVSDTALARSSAGFVGMGSTTNKVVIGHDGTNSDITSSLGALWLRAGQSNGNVLFSRASDGTAANSASFAVMSGAPRVRLRADVPLTWSASAADTLGPADTELARSSAGFVGMGSTTNKVVVGHDGTNGLVQTPLGYLNLADSGGTTYIRVGNNGSNIVTKLGGGEHYHQGKLTLDGGLGGMLAFQNGGPADTRIRRSAAGVLDIDSGTNGDYRDLKLRNLVIGGTAAGHISLDIAATGSPSTIMRVSYNGGTVASFLSGGLYFGSSARPNIGASTGYSSYTGLHLNLANDNLVRWTNFSDSYTGYDTELARSSAGFVGLGSTSNKVVVGRDGTTYGTVRAEDTVLTLGTSLAGVLGDYLQIAQNSTWSFKQSGSVRATLLNAQWCLNSSGVYGWGPNATAAANQDTELTRSSAGFVGIGSTANKVVVGHDGTRGSVLSSSGALQLSPYCWALQGTSPYLSVDEAGSRGLGTPGSSFTTLVAGSSNVFAAIGDGNTAIAVTGLHTWSSTSSVTGTADTALGRNSAGVVEINNGTAGQYRDLMLRNLTSEGNITLTIPTVTGGTPTRRLTVTDGTTEIFGAPYFGNDAYVYIRNLVIGLNESHTLSLNSTVQGGGILLSPSGTYTGTVAQFQTQAVGQKALILKGYSGQTANLTEWQNSGGTAVLRVDASGRPVLPDNQAFYWLTSGGTAARVLLASSSIGAVTFGDVDGTLGYGARVYTAGGNATSLYQTGNLTHTFAHTGATTASLNLASAVGHTIDLHASQTADAFRVTKSESTLASVSAAGLGTFAGLTVRQSGGVAGTDDGVLSHDGSSLSLVNNDTGSIYADVCRSGLNNGFRVRRADVTTRYLDINPDLNGTAAQINSWNELHLSGNNGITPVRLRGSVIYVTGSGNESDTALARNAAGVLELNNGTAGQYRDLRLRKIGVGRAAASIPLEIQADAGGNGLTVFGTGGEFALQQGGVLTSFQVNSSTVPLYFGTSASATVAGSEVRLITAGQAAVTAKYSGATQLGFYGATPVAQQSGGVEAGLVALGLFSSATLFPSTGTPVTVDNFKSTLATDAGTAVTLGTGTSGRVYELTAATAVAVTLSASAPVGFTLTVVQAGAGQLTFTADTGATLRHRSGHTKTAGQWAAVTLYVRANSGGSAAEWVMAGDTTV